MLQMQILLGATAVAFLIGMSVASSCDQHPEYLGSPVGAVALMQPDAPLMQDPGVSKALKEEFERKFAAIEKGDGKAFLALAEWAEKSGLQTESKKAYRAVLDSEPDNATARAKLGFVKLNGEWVTKEKAAELEKSKGGDPKKKGGGPKPPAPSAGANLQVDSKADLEEGKRIAKVIGEAVVVTSRHFSVKGAISRDQGLDVLAAAEQAYAELNTIFERGADEDMFAMRRLDVFFLKDEASVRQMLPYIEENYGKIDPYLKEDIQKNGNGMAANGGRPLSVTKAEVDLKSYFMHQLGQVYIELIAMADPWLAEGFATYTAVRFTGKNSTHCVNVSSYAGNVGGSKRGEDTAYLLICKEISQDKSDSPIESLQKKKLNQLDDKDIAKAFSIVKICMEKETDKGLAFLKLYSSQNVARVLRASFKMTPSDFDEFWRGQHK